MGKKQSLAQREEAKFTVSENRALSKIFGRKREVVTEGRRKLHDEELHEGGRDERNTQHAMGDNKYSQHFSQKI
jgi:hypothetical protein